MADANALPDSLPECIPVSRIEWPALHLTVSVDPMLKTLYPDWESRQNQLDAILNAFWPPFLEVASKSGVFDVLGVDPARHTLEIELTWVGNERIRFLNREYRRKDAATDVLTFTLLADSPNPAMWLNLPVLQPGNIFVSIPWAEEATPTSPENREQQLLRYLIERVTHGFLHLHGVHHDTLSDYERVVSIQNQVLAMLFPDLTPQDTETSLR